MSSNSRRTSASLVPSGSGYYCKRVRIQDCTAMRDLGFPDKTGEVKYTKRFATYAAAKREGDAWADSGDWIVTIHRQNSDIAAEPV